MLSNLLLCVSNEWRAVKQPRHFEEASVFQADEMAF